jgi:uncharacterized membrane protein YphA (DoxX/SURF4 family)
MSFVHDERAGRCAAKRLDPSIGRNWTLRSANGDRRLDAGNPALWEDRVASTLDRMFAWPVSSRLYGLGAVALGITGLFWGDFAVVWQPESNGVHNTWGYAVAAIPLLAGLTLQWRSTERLGAWLLTAFYGLAVIFLDIPRGFAQASVFVAWYGVFENFALAAPGIILCAHFARLDSRTSARITKAALVGFGICLIYFGLAHHFYLAATAKMVPAYLPLGQTFWAYATAAGHIGAGIAIIAGVWARPAAILLTAMFIVFTLLVHLPIVLGPSASHFSWGENGANLALIGAAWVIVAAIPKAKASD